MPKIKPLDAIVIIVVAVLVGFIFYEVSESPITFTIIAIVLVAGGVAFFAFP